MWSLVKGKYTKYRLYLIFSLVIITPLGFLTKFYHGVGATWVQDSLGGVLYEIFWIWLILFFKPTFQPFQVALTVFLVTSFLEFLQLWHPFFLEYLRSYFLGRTLLGNFFTWWDFPYYILGCLSGAWGASLFFKLAKTGK